MTNMTQAPNPTKNLEDLIRKIEALLNTADHPNTPEHEADTARNMAEALMFKYRIEEHQLSADGEAPSVIESPDWSTFVVSPYDSEFDSHYYSLFLSVVRHFDLMTNLRTEYRDDMMYYVGDVVGYESDRRFVQMVWQSIRLSFQKNLEPRVDPDLSFEENCYNLRNAGMEGWKIARAVFGDDAKSNRIKARNAARKWAERVGEDASAFSGRGNNMKAYRVSYRQAFISTIQGRLHSMARARAIEEAGTLVLASRTEAIKEAYYERFPDARPKPAMEGAARSTRTEQDACKKCQKAKSGYCRDHSWMRPRKPKTVRLNQGAYARGTSAAQSVDLGITNREVN